MNAAPSTLQIDAPRLPAAAAVGSLAAHGAMWTLLFSGLTKVMTFGSQIAIAWFLVPEEFGLVAMTLSAMSFTAMVGSGNLRNILVQRADRFAEEAGQVFWLALTLNMGAALFLAAFSPLAGILFNEPRVVALILIASLAPVLQSLSTVYLGALQRDLRFRRVAMIQCGASAVQNGSAVLLAWQGFGAAALVLPLAFTAIWTAVAYRISAGKIVLGRPEPKRWRALGTPVWWLMTNSLFTALLASSASAMVGLVQHDPSVLGFYYWGFAVSSQAVFLLVTNLQGVLFPALSRLNADPERQFVAVEKAARTLLSVIAPICVLQWLLAGPLVSSLFPNRWGPAIPVVESISAGLFTEPLYLLAVSVLLAKGRFRQLALTTGLVAVTTMLSASAGASLGDQSSIAEGAGLALLLSNLVAGWMTFREFGRGWTQLFALLTPIMVIAVFVAGLGWWTSRMTGAHGATIQIMATTAVVLLSHGLLIKLFIPQVAGDLAVRLFKGRPDSGFAATRNVNSGGRLQP